MNRFAIKAAKYLSVIALTAIALTGCKNKVNTALESLELSEVVSGFTRPVYVTHANDDSGRLFVVEQDGLVKIFDQGEILEEAFLDLSQKVSRTNWEQGLLSLSFHPDYASNGRFFVFYVSQERNQSVVSEFRVSSTNANKASLNEKVLLEVETAMGAHYGGHIDFGKDDYLYISIGDGYRRPERFDGSIFPAQDLSNLPGSILRIDVDNGEPYAIPKDNPFAKSKKAKKEIWAYGFKNPWRFSFDAKTGELYAGDVGLYKYEEVSKVKKGGNYGWAIREGQPCYVPTLRGRLGCYLRSTQKQMKAPIVTYPHLEQSPEGGNSVTGGYVYRGEKFPELHGVYFFADFVAGKIWSLNRSGRSWKQTLIFDLPATYSSFGEGPKKELYVIDWSTGTIFEMLLAN